MSETTERLLDEISKKLNILIALSLRQLPPDRPLHQKIQKVGETSRLLATTGIGGERHCTDRRRAGNKRAHPSNTRSKEKEES